MEAETTTIPAAALPAIADLSYNAIYLMGISFVLGSLFTIFVLVIFDLLRGQRNAK